MAQDFTQTASTSNPSRTVSDSDFGGNYSITANGTSDYMYDAGSGDVGDIFANGSWNAHTIYFAVSRPAVANTTQTILYSAGASESYRIQTTQTSSGGIYVQVYGYDGTNTRYVECPLFDTSSDRFFICIRNQGTGGATELEVMINSRQSTSVDPNGGTFVTDLTGMDLNGLTELFRNTSGGGTNYMSGKFADMFIYQEAHPDATVDGMFAWLNGEFGSVTKEGWGFNKSSTVANASRVVISDNANLSFPSGDWSIGGWVRLMENTGSSFKYIYSHGLGSGNEVFFLIGESGSGIANLLRFVAHDSGSGSITGFDSTTSVGTSADWQHVMYIRSGNTLTLYVDGVSQNSRDITGFGSITPSGVATIGCRNDTGGINGYDVSTNRYHKGLLKDWAKWDRALTVSGSGTANELATLVAGGAAKDTSVGSPVWNIEMDPAVARSQTTSEIGALTIQRPPTSNATQHLHGVYL